MKKKLAMTLCCLLAASTIFGCGNTVADGSSDASTEAVSDEKAAPTTEASESVSVENNDNSSDALSSENESEEVENSNSNTSSNFSIDVEFGVIAFQHISKVQSILVVSRLTNNSDQEYDLDIDYKLDSIAKQGDVDLERIPMGSDNMRGTIAPGQTILIMDGFKLENVDDVTVTWSEVTDHTSKTEFASRTFTTEELIKSSLDYINDEFDTSEYDEEFLFLKKDIQKIVDDLGLQE